MMARRTSIHTKIVVPFVVLVVVVFSIAAFTATQVVASAVERQVSSQIADMAEFISGAGFPLSEGTLRSMGELLDVGLASVDADHAVRDSNLDAAIVAALPDALRSSVRHGDSTTVFPCELDGRDFYVAFAPVGKSSNSGLVLLYDAARLRAAQWESVWPILASALAAVLLANLFGYYIARSITRPLRLLAASTAQVASGDLSQRISVGTRDELEQLARDFNSMVESLRSSQQELLRREKLATLGTVAAGIAHEIRNPLTSMKMTAEMLSSGKVSDSDREALDLLLGEIERLRLTTGALLEYAGPTAPEPAQVEAAKAVEEVLSLMKRQLSHHKVQIETAFPETAVAARIDPNRLKQIVLNLVLNAVDAMPEGGRLKMQISESDDSVRLTATDTGTGIPAEDMDRVFEPFYSTRKAGCGLGLAISKRFVEEAGGSISVSSTAAGTAFTVSLPAGSSHG